MFGRNKNENNYGIEEESQEYEKAKSTDFRNGVTVGLFIALVLFVATLTIVYLQSTGKIGQLTQPAQSASTEDTTVAQSSESVVSKKTMSKMQSIEKLINDYYYLNEVDEETLENGVYSGMIDALGDKYATYYTPEELVEETTSNQGVYYGIGAYVSVDKETEMPVISGIIENTPAQEAGLRAGDIIYSVDGTSTFQMGLNDVVALIKGEENTMVLLTIVRDDEALEVEVTRRRVTSPTVTSKMLENDIGYIQITEFDEVTVDQFTENLAMMKGSGAKALVLDLRGNPGGLLSAVVSIGQQMLPEGLIVYTEDKAGNREDYKSDGSRALEIPLVVLVNGGSASAAEILTGAVKDYGTGTIVGTTTYGKGIVQKIYGLTDGSAVKMTVSAYYTPKGNNIHGTGIAPDVEIELDADAYYASPSVDNQLEKAKEILLEQIK